MTVCLFLNYTAKNRDIHHGGLFKYDFSFCLSGRITSLCLGSGIFEYWIKALQSTGLLVYLSLVRISTIHSKLDVSNGCPLSFIGSVAFSVVVHDVELTMVTLDDTVVLAAEAFTGMVLFTIDEFVTHTVVFIWF